MYMQLTLYQVIVYRPIVYSLTSLSLFSSLLDFFAGHV